MLTHGTECNFLTLWPAELHACSTSVISSDATLVHHAACCRRRRSHSQFELTMWCAAPATTGLLMLAASAATVVTPSDTQLQPIDPADRAALLRLREANAGQACPRLLSWGAEAAVDGCEWAGVTCLDGRVTVIDLRYCSIAVLPPESLVLDKLEVLELRGNMITVVPSTVSHLVSLQRIMVEMNQLTELPPQLCKLPKLGFLYIAYNKLTALPDCIGQMPVVDLWLRGNNVPVLPDSFCDITTGVAGHLDGSGLTRLPDCIGKVKFNGLFLQNNKLTSLPSSMAQIFTWPGVHALELANNKLTSLPDWVANATNITELNLEHNALTEIPSALPPHLTTLRLAGNPILTTDAQLNPTVTLMQTLSEQTMLTTLSVGFSPAGLSHPGFLVESMPGMQAGIARCPGTLDRRVQARCPFVIQT